MFRNYLVIAWRNIARNKIYSLINIAGLAIGIAAGLLIFVVVTFELSYDKFQAHYDGIYRIVTDTREGNGNIGYNEGVCTPVAKAMQTDFPQLAAIANVNIADGSQVTLLGSDPNKQVANTTKFIEKKGIIFTSPSWFRIFNSQFLAGDAHTLEEPGHTILDQSTASRYFGDWKLAVGKYLLLDNTILLKITGIIADAPANTDFPVKILVAYETLKRQGARYGYSKDWGTLSSTSQLYVLVPPAVHMAELDAQLHRFNKKYYPASPGRADRYNRWQPLRDLHFDPHYGTMGPHVASKPVLITLSLIGLLIIVMAAINFINLSTAQAVGRSREVGIRKVMGSSRSQLIAQALGETGLLVLFALVLGIVLSVVCKPVLLQVSNVPPAIHLVTTQTFLFATIVFISITLLAGTYPALVLSGFKPAQALKHKISAASVGNISLQRVLVVTQFTISQVLIAGTIIAVAQMNFLRNADLGFNRDAVLVVPAYADSAMAGRMAALKQELLRNPSVETVSFASDEASSDNNWASNFAFDYKRDEDYPVFFKYADKDYAAVFGLKLLAGRWYDAADTAREFVVNETLLKKAGQADPQQAIGKMLRVGGGPWRAIVGVVRDFKMNSLREVVKPLLLTTGRKDYYTINIKIRPGNLATTAEQIKVLWEKTYPEYAYTAHFSDDTIQAFYQQDKQMALLYKLFAGIAIFISCLGLYGLVSFMAVQKTKEVGIRKVLGASITSIVVMFSREFTALIGIAFLLAAPLAWYGMSQWLQNFAFRVNIGWTTFLFAITATLLIAWVTVGYRAIRAALANPVSSLRNE